ncbi:DNA-binding protein [Ktedonosporobacter rubrisoli]|uniref:DNA-binding protein n=1 Tax=Ktedonosporobacter rubrisoli TaxID=2509675 RepID=A0A4P6K341_KTERU|nr:DNA-binding protein [Ktedonosporobacter rubrisoli]
MAQNEDEYLTPQKACDYLGVSRRTLERYAEAGRITKYRRGIKRAVYFKKVELDGLLEIRPDKKSNGEASTN